MFFIWLIFKRNSWRIKPLDPVSNSRDAFLFSWNGFYSTDSKNNLKCLWIVKNQPERYEHLSTPIETPNINIRYSRLFLKNEKKKKEITAVVSLF